MDKDKKKALEGYVDEVGLRLAAIKEEQEAIKEILQAAQEKHQFHPKIIKALAKEKNLSEIEREERQLIEQQMDECRLALGMLADTPLGQAVVEEVEKKSTNKKRNGRGTGKSKEPSEAFA